MAIYVSAIFGRWRAGEASSWDLATKGRALRYSRVIGGALKWMIMGDSAVANGGESGLQDDEILVFEPVVSRPDAARVVESGDALPWPVVGLRSRWTEWPK